jgi:hypothetical protein
LNKTLSPVLIIGLLIFVGYVIIETFIMPLSYWIAIPLLVFAIILIIIGGLKTK